MTKKKTNTDTKTQQAPKPAKIKTKTEVRNASAQADKLVRGMDNNSVSIQKHQQEIEKKIAENAKSAVTVRSLIAGISNVALTAQPAPAPAKAKTAAKAKPAAKAAAKPASKSASGGVEWRTKHKLDIVARDIVASADKPLTAAEIYHGCEAYAKKHAFKDENGDDDCWSRQSLYNQLKIVARFTKSGDGATATYQNAASKAASKAATDQDADEYVKKVEKNQTVANVS